ncbi:hypothetical protein HAX54_027132 [Datura stramonium]|uniref:ATPase F1/V1/A1 complex alpha/beta subunit nucleotide-binding domain-containing protein n=1 Tax=Datura stramonium TaxID=4076 RepID=A0ABS8V2E8_DATST|nr:hypothetical protein [Datura stramonium]
MGDGLLIQEGSSVKATGRIAQIPVSEAYLGRVVNALAKPIDGRVKFQLQFRLIESAAAGIISRRSVYDPLQTGLSAIDSMIYRTCYWAKASSVAQVVTTLQKGAMEYTIGRRNSPDSPATLQYLAPYTGAALAEYFMYRRRLHTLIIYDDLQTSASLSPNVSSITKTPGREAYPGDVFYLHSRLLERAAKLSSS